MPIKKRSLILLAVVALVLVAGLCATSLRAQAKKKSSSSVQPNPNTVVSGPIRLTAPTVVRAIAFAETGPAREFPGADGAVDSALVRIDAEEINEQNSSDLFTPNPKAPPQYDGALQATWSPKGGLRFVPQIPAPILTFEGNPVQSSAPPDTTGAVGPNDYVQAVNATNVRVWDKNGVPRGPAFKLSSLFTPLGGIFANNNNGDPIVLYDRLANRWFITQFAFASSTTPPYFQAVAVSKTGDPTGAYWVYGFQSPGNEFPDYSHWGVWPDGYYATTRQFTNGATYNGFGVFAFDRAKMLVGDSNASFIYFNAGPNLSQSSSGMLPTDFSGLIPPPAGTPNTFAVYNDDSLGDLTDSLRLFDFTANFATPASSTFTERPESPLAVAAFDSRNPTGRADIEEPAPAVAADYLDSISDRLMMRLFYINRNGVQLLTTCHTVNAGIIPAVGVNPTVAEYKAGTRWYILQKTAPGANWSVQDQGTFSPDANERWMGSTALDNAGNLAVGYSISSTTQLPSIAYAGRLLGDPAGTLNQGEAIMFAGTGVQTGTSNRWGDYSHMTLDPSDDATFWYTNEYYATNGAFLWRTRVGTFKYANTTAPAQGMLSGIITACDTGAPLKDALVQVSGGPSAGFSSTSAPDGTYSMKLAPGSYTVTVINPAHLCTAAGPFTVTVTDGGSATQNACLSGVPTIVLNSGTVTASGGNGNGVIEPNECNTINVSILNNGCLLAKNVTATLSSSTPGVTVIQPNTSFNDVVESGSANGLVPFSVSTSNTFLCGTPINFTLIVKYDGGTATLSFSLPSCNTPPVVVNGALVPGTDPTQPVGRLGRNGVASVCGTSKVCPGAFGTGTRIYRQHMFTNGPAPACVTIATTQTCPTTSAIIPAAYLGSYDPANLCTNYLGDAGGSPGTTGNSFSVDLAANATLVVVISEANAGSVGCTGYQFTVSGLVGNSTGNGVCAPAPTAVSRKTHGTGGPTFDIPLPTTGAVGIEDRGSAGGTHRIVVSFTTSPVGATATILSRSPAGATGSISSTTVSGNDLIVDLTGVSNAQTLFLSISGGTNISPAVIPVGFLIGDVNADRSVNSGDLTITRNSSGQTLTSVNFRADVNADGAINSADATTVRNNSGQSLP